MSHEGTHVITLKGKEQFDSFIQKNKYVLVDFSTEWCHWCKVLAPEYKAAAEVFHDDKGEESTKTKLVYVDGDEEENSELLKKYEVGGFPTIKYFQNGDLETAHEFSGDRTKDGIVSWCKKRTMAAVVTLNNSNQFSEFTTSSTKGRDIALVVWRQGDPTKDKLLKIIYELADGHRDEVSVGHVADEKLAKECSLSSPLTLFRSFDTPIVLLKPKNLEDATAEDIWKLIKAEKFALVDEISRDNASDYMSSGFPLAWVSVQLEGESDEKTGDKKLQFVNLLKPFAEKYKGQLLFVLLNIAQFKAHAESMGLAKTPGLLIQQDDKKYMFSGDVMNGNAVTEFFDAWANGKLPVYRKTQEPPERQDPDGAFVLVGSTFEDHVGTKDKDVFVDFYADWCPPCQRMVPTYKELAQKFKGVGGLMIAKINADKNDTFQPIESYPTLFFFKKGSREGIKYQGDRSLQSFVEFVKANATVDCSSVTI